MPRRVSMKGKGAEIFFGDYSASPPDPRTTDEPERAAAPPLPPAARASEQERILATKQESMHTRTRKIKQAITPADPATDATTPAAVLNGIWRDLTERATVTNAFRYTDRELEALTDALYAVHKRHGVKLSKQEVARLGLNAVLWDYREHGETSLLAELIRRRKRQPFVHS